jgi:hypothetical protein
LTQAQYERELAAGRIDTNAFYLTPDNCSEAFASAELITIADIDAICADDDINALVNAKLAEIPAAEEVEF